MLIYGDSRSANCLKVKWTADFLGRTYDWIETDILQGESRTPAYLAMNPAGQVPTVILDDGRPLSQSNAIITYLAEGSALIPSDPYDRGRMLEWMYWEQYSHEPTIAVARFQLAFLGNPRESLDPKLVERGKAALARLELGLARSRYLVSDRLSLADIALVGYTRWAHEGGFDLARYPKIRNWISRLEQDLKLSD